MGVVRLRESAGLLFLGAGGLHQLKTPVSAQSRRFFRFRSLGSPTTPNTRRVRSQPRSSLWYCCCMGVVRLRESAGLLFLGAGGLHQLKTLVSAQSRRFFRFRSLDSPTTPNTRRVRSQPRSILWYCCCMGEVRLRESDGYIFLGAGGLYQLKTPVSAQSRRFRP